MRGVVTRFVGVEGVEDRDGDRVGIVWMGSRWALDGNFDGVCRYGE